MMKTKLVLMTSIAFLLFATGVSGDGETWSYDDESGDVQYTMGSYIHADDIDVISLTLDQSGDPLIITMTVVGEIKGLYGVNGSDGYNSYTIGLDLDGDEDYAEINVEINGLLHDDPLYISIRTPSTIEPLGEENYTISGSTFTARIDREHMDSYSSVLDFTGSNKQMAGINNGFDYINYNFGGDDKPYDDGSSTDDDDTTDDDTDDDTIDDEDENSDNGLCGSVLFISAGILIATILAILTVMKVRK